MNLKVVELSVLMGLSVGMVGVARADLPLTVENAITDKGKFRVEWDAVYSNRNQSGVTTAGSNTIVVSGSNGTTIITVPNYGNATGTQDILVNTLGLHYGVTPHLEVYMRGSYLSNQTQVSGNFSNGTQATTSSTTNHFNDMWAGVNYQFRDNRSGPALLGFAEVAVSELYPSERKNLSSATLGYTTYHAIDPVVLQLTSGWRFGRVIKTNIDGVDVNYRSGQVLYLSPSVSLAVNEMITLSGGVQWQVQFPSKYNDVKQGYRQTTTDLNLGASLGVTRDDIVTLGATTNASGQNGADLRLNWAHRF